MRNLLFAGLWLMTGALAARGEPVEEVVVTATREARALRDIPESVSVVGTDEIADTPAQSLDDILRRTPAVDVPVVSSYQAHPTSNNVSMRGIGGIHALVLLDGVPLNDPFFGYVQWGQIPLETIDRVEVVRGGAATLWGNYAMGGVMNVLTRTPETSGVVLQAGAGSYGTHRASAHVDYVLSDAARLGFDYGTNHTDGFDQVRSRERRSIHEPTDFTARNAALSGTFELADGLVAETRFRYHENDQGLITRAAANEQRGWVASGSLTQELADGSTLTGTLFQGDSRFRTDNTATPPGESYGDAEYIQNLHRTPVRDSGASLIWSTSSQGWLGSLSIGADYHGIEGKDEAQIFDPAAALLRTDVGSGEQRFLGSFVQLSLLPIESLEILASVRYQRFENFDAFDGTPGGLGDVPDQDESSVDPRVSVRYALTPEVAVRGAVYEAFRAPSLDNLYRAFSTPAGIFYPNAQLQPETLKGAELGIDLELGDVRTQITAFTNEIDDLITSRSLASEELPDGFFFGSRNINVGSARARGIEAEAQWQIGDGWNAQLGYTRSDSTIRDNPLDPVSEGKQQIGVPRDRFTTAVTYASTEGWRASTSLRWLSKSYGSSDNTLEVDRHVVVDVSATYPLTPQIDVFVQVENAFGKRYIADNSGFSPALLGTPLTTFVGFRWTVE